MKYGPRIVSDGLTLAIDAADLLSYPGSGTTWRDLSGSGSNGTLSNGPTFGTAGNGCIITDGVDDFVQLTSVMSTTSTVDIVYKLLNPGTGWGPLWRSTDWKERIFPSTITLVNSAGTYYNVGGPDGTTNIIHICYSYSGTNVKSYKNGALVNNITMDAAMNTGNFVYRFGNQAGGATNAFINMQLFCVKFYNRQLSDAEVLQNFNATKGRFSL